MALTSLNKPEFEDSMWVPPVKEPWYRQWSKGWRLVVVILVLLSGVYLSVRRLKDYRSLKAAYARSLAREALAKKDQPQEAVALFEKAAALAPNDTEVLRSIADFTEPMDDRMAVYSLRKLVSNAQPTPADRERLCRLAFDWGLPELADVTILKQWAASDPSTLALRPLDLSARWMANRGQHAEAEHRLRSALAKAGETADKPSLQFVLAKLLMAGPAAGTNPSSAQEETIQLLAGAIISTAPPLAMRAEAARLMGAALLQAGLNSKAAQEAIALVRSTLNEESEAVKNTNPLTSLNYRIQLFEFDIDLNPSVRQSLAKQLLESVEKSDDAQKLTVANWLNSHELSLMALTLCESQPAVSTQRTWFTAKLDALFNQKNWSALVEQLSAPNQPLPAIIKSFFLYRVSLARQDDQATLDQARASIVQNSLRTDPKDILYVASILEKLGEYQTALTLYTAVQNDPRAGLPARLGTIRCLTPQPARSGELVAALDDIVGLWPSCDQARGDLAYLRLLDRNARHEDSEFVHEAQRTFPDFLAYRIAAALSHLRDKNPAEALKLLPPEYAPPLSTPGWRSVYACVLAANNQEEKARDTIAGINMKSLRPGERRLLEEFLLVLPE